MISLLNRVDDLRRHFRAVVVLAFATSTLAISGCATPPSMPSDTASTEYTLDAGDRVQIDVYDQQGLSGAFTLDSAGKVSLLRAGVVDLKGKTLREAETLIESGLSQEFNNPEVTVNMVEYRPFFVLGEVQQPGKFPFESGLTVVKAVALAGGYRERADPSAINLIRNGQSPHRVTESTLLQPGDTISVLQRWF